MAAARPRTTGLLRNASSTTRLCQSNLSELLASAYSRAHCQPPNHGGHRTLDRPFSTSRRALAPRNQVSSPQMKSKPQRSMTVQMAEMKHKMLDLTDDFGILPGTFVTPVGKNKPSVVHKTRGRVRWEWVRLKARLKDLATAAIFKWSIKPLAPEAVDALPRLEWWKYKLLNWHDLETVRIPSIAKELYEEMYNKFAAGTIDSMRPRLCEAIYASLRNRIKTRPPNTKISWQVHNYIGKPRIVSYKQTLMSRENEGWEADALQQAVVRIRSIQSLQRVKRVSKGKGKETVEVVEEGSVGQADGSRGKEVVEYLVIQKLMKKGEPEHWKIWGTTEETTLEKLPAWEKTKSQMGG